MKLRSDDKPRRYGQWAGRRNGYAEDVTLCIEGVFPGNSFIEHQCSRKRGHGKDGNYCKQHAKRNPA